ncbi:hypothetical protein GIB67_038475 [Kingdonia uniflora]|uniref:Uncharacterized protein n=1 Tax=Kingdonia uniflora TaxID=39325 RepID=A0A7J7NPX5_9MAGN|nr:hypothetical protein GIB67_038475 [Kingdonia uniflora]
MESLKKFFEEKLQSATGKIEALNGSMRVIEDKVEKHKLLYDALQTQLPNARVELNEACQKASSLDVKLEDKSTSCQELEATCLDLQLHLERYDTVGAVVLVVQTTLEFVRTTL